MREDLLAEVRGRVIDKHGTPVAGRAIEFLPSRPYFVIDGDSYCPLGARQVTDAEGKFSVLLTRTDLTGIQYLTRGALGQYRISLDGPGPHTAAELLKAGRKVRPPTR